MVPSCYSRASKIPNNIKSVIKEVLFDEPNLS
jgi:hypothetical protein